MLNPPNPLCLAQHGGKKIFLTFEMVVEASLGHVRRAQNVAEGGVIESLKRKELQRFRDDLLARIVSSDFVIHNVFFALRQIKTSLPYNTFPASCQVRQVDF
jgi:hypothetical protein